MSLQGEKEKLMMYRKALMTYRKLLRYVSLEWIFICERKLDEKGIYLLIFAYLCLRWSPPMVLSATFEPLDAQKIAPCFEGTRMDILDQLRQWINNGDTSNNSAPVFWTNGLAGTGKMTPAYTITGNCKRCGIPVTSFFCSCNFSERYNPNLIFVSIAHWLGRIFPLFRENLAEVLQLNPHLASAVTVLFQLEELVSSWFIQSMSHCDWCIWQMQGHWRHIHYLVFTLSVRSWTFTTEDSMSNPFICPMLEIISSVRIMFLSSQPV